LFRPQTIDQIESLVALHAGSENEHSQQLFRQSLQAGWTIEELMEILSPLGIDASSLLMTSDRHWTLKYRKPVGALS
jgi:hypothetical protein